MRTLELTAHMKKISRGDGRSATAAAAYRACCIIECEREGRTHDYSRKRGLEASGIVLPDAAPAWAKERGKLWNAAELKERNGKRGKRAGEFKADARVAREFMFSFPAELSAAGRLHAAEAVARYLVGTHGVAADYSIHQPGKDGDERNYHCHMMTTTRRMTADGLAEKAREWDDVTTGPEMVREWRAFVAQTMNAELAAEGKANLVHVEHRSFEERGTGQTPTRHQGPGRTHAVRKKQKGARDGWRRSNRDALTLQQNGERAALKTRQGFNLATHSGYLDRKEIDGIAAIRAQQQRDRAADNPKRLSRAFEIATGRSAKADFDRAQRSAARDAAADRAVADLKDSVRAERVAYVEGQLKEQQALADKHKAEDSQLDRAMAVRIERDRMDEVQARRDQVRGVERQHERGQTRDRDGPGMQPS